LEKVAQHADGPGNAVEGEATAEGAACRVVRAVGRAHARREQTVGDRLGVEIGKIFWGQLADEVCLERLVEACQRPLAGFFIQFLRHDVAQETGALG